MSKELIERLLDNRVTGFNLSVAAVEAAERIEMLEQQLAAAQAEIERKMSAGKFVVEQLADSQKREVMLRHALERLVTERRAGLVSPESWNVAREALAATEADRLRLREQLEQIAEANPREWDELSEPPSQFE